MFVRDVEDAIWQVRKIIKAWDRGDIPDLDEAHTRRMIIDPVLGALGWPINYGPPQNRKPCITEFYPYEGDSLRVDYAMFDSYGNERMIVEAKRISEHTMDHYDQLADYCEDAVNITAALTNGEWWNIIDIGSFQKGYCKEYPPLNISNGHPQHKAETLYSLLSREVQNQRHSGQVRYRRRFG